ncbi:phosphoserine phosphatase SerB [Croceicoccus sp. YJ47]|uniref:phosphoserine phosphatase SerB n=1 Tax=Croceicoccus sp. YJ47 TaxID=2798724 RepID=UPI001920FD57|nr:phosphoserine phosphatase SerB [Croceicoccus sp. YJ47]QQN74124.1 phosphoserine phosphatase SerB [Croceicoccus sp. YJ47]
MLIARLIADSAKLETGLDTAGAKLAERGWTIAGAQMMDFCGDVLQISLPEGESSAVASILDQAFGPCDLLISDRPIEVPHLLISDMDSTMIGQECIDELADFAGLKDEISAITERAMRGELDFEAALTERVGLLAGLAEETIAQCLAERIEPVRGARKLVQTLRSRGAHTVLVTGGFHSFADPVADMIGFERVVGNRLAIADGQLTGKLASAIVDSGVKARTLREEMDRLGDNARSLAMGDGANDIPMLQAADYGIAYRAKPKAREAANGWIERGDLTAVLELFDIPRAEWVD